MVPITMDLEGRAGADVVLSRSIVVVEPWESLSWFVMMVGSLRSSLREVLRRFLVGIMVALEVAVVGERQGRSRRRVSILVIGF